MGYRKPETVVSPKSRWLFGETLCDLGQGEWSAARGFWDGKKVVAIRWNGDDDSGQHGNPQSHGNPTWFIVPRELERAVTNVASVIDEAVNSIIYSVNQLPEFYYGAYAMRLELSNQIAGCTIPSDVLFNIPEFPKRLFRPTENYMIPPSGPKEPWRGRFIDRVWEGILQTNGVAEENSAIAVDVVRDALVANVIRSIKPWIPSLRP